MKKYLFILLPLLLLTVSLLSCCERGVVCHVADYEGEGTAAIQAAIDACPAGGTVFIPAGEYKATAPLRLKSDITLRGEEGTVIVTDEAFAVSHAGGPLLINESATHANGYTEHNIVIDSIVFDGKRMENCSASQIYLGAASDVTIKNCTFRDNIDIALAMAGCRNVTVQNCLFEGIGLPKPSTVSKPALWTGELSGVMCQNISVLGCTFRNNLWSGCYFMPDGGKIVGCTFIDNGESSIYTNGTGRNIQYIDNYICGARKSNISCTGIETEASDALIEGNLIENCGASGISVTNCQNVTVRGNMLLNNGQEEAEGYGIFLYSLRSVEEFAISDSSKIPGHILIEDNIFGNTALYKATQIAPICAWKNEHGEAIFDLIIRGNRHGESDHGCFRVIGNDGFDKTVASDYLSEDNETETVTEEIREQFLKDLTARQKKAAK